MAFVKSLGLKVGVLSVAVVTTNVLVVVPTVILADVVFPPLPEAFSEKVIVWLSSFSNTARDFTRRRLGHASRRGGGGCED